MFPTQPGDRRKTAIATWFEERLAWDSIRDFIAHKTVPVHSRHPVVYVRWNQPVSVPGPGDHRHSADAVLPSYGYRGLRERGFIMTRVAFGWLIRSIHSWTANLMICGVRAYVQRRVPSRLPETPRIGMAQGHGAAGTELGSDSAGTSCRGIRSRFSRQRSARTLRIRPVVGHAGPVSAAAGTRSAARR